VIQGDATWHLARRGRVTASRFREVVTGSPLQWVRRLSVLRAEAAMDDEAYLYMVGHESDRGPRGWGHAFERKARALYEIQTDRIVHETGVLVHPDDDLVSCSPDGLVGDDGGIEIKCAYDEAKAAANAIHGFDSEEYGYQVQGCLWITRRSWWDCLAYDPRQPVASSLAVHRVGRNEPMISRIAQRVTAFTAHLRAGTDPSIYNPKTDAVPNLF